MVDEVATLIKRVYSDGAWEETERQVFCGVRSIGQSEFYQANATTYRPELKIVLADYLEYDGENIVEYNGQRFRVVRTYRTGLELEIVLESASKEEGSCG